MLLFSMGRVHPGSQCFGKCPLRAASVLRSSRTTRLACAASSSKVNVLVVGGGGREHALAWKLAQSPLCDTLHCAPGNTGIAAEPAVEVAPKLDVSNHKEVIDFCKNEDINLVAVGPEAPLVAGLSDDLSSAGIRTFGPSQAASQLEGSKAFMKDLCKKYNVPSATYEKFTDADEAKSFIKKQGAPIVVKADGLAAGKGAIVCKTLEEAFEAVDSMMVKATFGEAGKTVVVEEFLEGEEVSYFALIDGESVVPLGSSQDHKAVGEGDVGPNTGGMGAYSPAPALTPDIEQKVLETIIRPTASGMVTERCPYRGVIFAGLMISNGQPKLLEYNVRFGDPECQGLLMRLNSDLLETMIDACDGNLKEDTMLEWSPQSALTVVLAAKGYPGSYKKGTPIYGVESVTDAKVFHAGTASDSDGQLISSGGRVLGVTALGNDVREAQTKAYKAVDSIKWEEGFCRRDIGWRAVERLG
ncbi:hypothetical protein BSKO_02350 [Bryopsis sp. KO-2023]|nr:hypothetical protein BSKO_02350 [Bryopsis sp. KO-2023]